MADRCFRAGAGCLLGVAFVGMAFPRTTLPRPDSLFRRPTLAFGPRSGASSSVAEAGHNTSVTDLNVTKTPTSTAVTNHEPAASSVVWTDQLQASTLYTCIGTLLRGDDHM
jgi:hypothetical protein